MEPIVDYYSLFVTTILWQFVDMKLAIVSVPFKSDIGPCETFKMVRLESKDAFFFESSDAFGEPATTSVIGLGPFEKVKDPVFQSLQQNTDNQTMANSIPFSSGGYFGCVGYDAITEIEPKLARTGHFKNSSIDSSCVLGAKNLIVFDRKKKLIHFIGENAQRYEKSLVQRQPSEDFDRELEEITSARLTSTFGKKCFFDAVKVLKEHIRQGDIFQAVLAERFECEDIETGALEIFEALRKICPTPYSFFFTFSDRDFFGASPEALLKVTDGILTMNPIAGTRPRGKTESEDRLRERQLARSRKEAAEHLMLVDLARNDLGRVAQAGSVSVRTYRSIQKFSNVMHLVSEVSAVLSDSDTPIGALKACFPAGTLSGAPKFRAMEILAKLEFVPRGLYGGAVIAFDIGSKNLDTCIAIRSLEMINNRAILRAGAGIVADSKAQAEYDEIQYKLKPLRQAIALAERKDNGAVNR